MTINPSNIGFKLIPPSLRNPIVYAFRVLPTRRLIFGQLQVGGNVLQFVPQYALSSAKYSLNGKLKSDGMMQLPLDCIERVGLNDINKFSTPFSKIEILRSLGCQYNPSLIPSDAAFSVSVPSRIETTKRRVLDLDFLDHALNQANASLLDALNLLTNQAHKDQSRFLKIRTYKGEIFNFFSLTSHLIPFYRDIQELLLGCHHDNFDQLIEETSGSEDFSYIDVEPPDDFAKALEIIIRQNKNQFALFTRKARLYHKRQDYQKLKLTQYEITKMQAEKQKKRKEWSKKFENEKSWKWRGQFEYSYNYLKLGNQIDEPLIQNLENDLRKLKHQAEIERFEQQNDELSESDMEVPLYIEYEKKNLYKISRSMAQSKADHSISLLEAGIDEMLSKCDKKLIDATKQKQAQDVQLAVELNYNNIFVYRRSKIINEDNFRQFKNILNSKQQVLKIFVQYQATSDGRYLSNLFNSYDFSDNAGLSSWCAVDQSNAAGFNVSEITKNYVFSSYSLLILKIQGQIVGVFCDSDVKVGKFGDEHMYVFANGFTRYNYTGKNQVFGVADPRQMYFGSGKGQALMVKADLLRATSEQCETFNSPRLFCGDDFQFFVEGVIEEIELLRFVV